MSLFASLLVNAVVAAAPATALPWYTFDDYPQKAFDREWKGAATFEVLVDRDGKPANCTITHSTGYDVLDRTTCFVAMHRARFTPARGPDGNRVYGTYRSQVAWHRPDQERLQGDPGPDLEVTLAALPSGARQPPAVKLAYYVDAQGNPSACTPLPDSKVQPQPLVDAACAQLFGRVQHSPVTANGAAVPAVKTAAVLFSVAK
jgi:TonB family protein